MLSSRVLITLFSLLVAQVSAHGWLQTIKYNGKVTNGYNVDVYRGKTPSTKSIGWATTATGHEWVPAESYGSADIICHKNGVNGQDYLTVAAGSSMQMHWISWYNHHRGPVINYLANCGDDCTKVDKTTLKFFKINEVGMLDNTTPPGKWATIEMFYDIGNTWNLTIPPTVAAGKYVLRHEIFALHTAAKLGQAQLYPQCINLIITGGGTDKPPGISATEFYKENDPGIFIDIYKHVANYTIPGPSLYSGFSTGAAAKATGASSPPSTPKTSTSLTTVTVIDSSTTPQTSPTQSPAAGNSTSTTVTVGTDPVTIIPVPGVNTLVVTFTRTKTVTASPSPSP